MPPNCQQDQEDQVPAGGRWAVQVPLLTLHKSPPLSLFEEETTSFCCLKQNEEHQVKEWIWSQCKDQILEKMVLQFSSSLEPQTSSGSSLESSTHNNTTAPFASSSLQKEQVDALDDDPNKEESKEDEPATEECCSCSSLIQSHVATLDRKVQERTQTLELANQRLEQINQRVRQAAQSQLENFALISHEVRTPLNCILGLSSMLLHDDDCVNRALNSSSKVAVACTPQRSNTTSSWSQEKTDKASPSPTPPPPPMRQQLALSPSQRETVQMIVDAGDLLLTVINDVLDYSKLQTGHMDILPRPSSLGDILAAVVHNIERKTGGGGPDVVKKNCVQVRAICSANVPEIITTDPRRLTQVLYNLLGNSWKYAPAGSVVELGVELDKAMTTTASGGSNTTSTRYFYTPQERERRERMQSEELLSHKDDTTTLLETTALTDVESSESSSSCSSERVSESPPPTKQGAVADGKSSSNVGDSDDERGTSDHKQGGGIIRFKVKDYGKGIALNDFPRIFQPFRQASAETEQVQGGTGLGLAVAAKLVHGLGGVISVDSVCGEWTEFFVELPLLESPFPIEQVATKLSTTTKVYLIENNPNTAQQLTRILDSCRVPHQVFSSMMAMEDDISSHGPLDRERVFLCMVHETLYEAEAYDLLSNLATSLLVTYGPNYSVSDGAHHFSAPHKILPSVMLTTLQQLVQKKRTPGFSRSNSFSSTASTSVYTIPTSELRVLIAEDNHVNQLVLERMLHRIKVKDVTIVDDGIEAVEACLKKDFDLILMDMSMPRMGGVESCQAILSHAGIVHKPKIVFVTAHAGASFEDECYQAGASGFLTKPYKLQEIEDCVASVEMEVVDPSVFGLAEQDFEEDHACIFQQ